MKIQKKSYKKILIVSSVALALTLLSYATYAKTQERWPFKTGKPEASETSSNDTSNDNPSTDKTNDKESTDSSSINSNQSASPKTPTENESTSDNSSGTPVTITSVQTIGSDVRVRSLIETVTNSGSCDIVFEKNGKTVRQNSGIQALASSSTCKGFTIPVSQLSSGIWHITLKVTTKGNTSKATKDYKVN